MSIENTLRLEAIHCRGCSRTFDDSLDLFSLCINPYFENYRNQPGKLLPVKCKLALLHSDGYLAFGPDSGVFKLGEPDMVMKIYPGLSKKDLLTYQKEIERARLEYPKEVEASGKEFEIGYTPITEVAESLYGHRCAISCSPFVPGPNYYRYLLNFYNRYEGSPPLLPINFEKILTSLLRDYCRLERKSTVKDSGFFYMNPRNFNVDFEKRRITVTDLADNIPKFLDSLALC